MWRVADIEARQLKAEKIEPIHLLLALAKCVDLDLTAIVSKKSDAQNEILEELLREVRRVRTVFRTAKVDAKVFRRHLRKATPDMRFAITESGPLHRSSAAKRVFSDAQRLATISDRTVYPVHLLLSVLSTRDEVSSEVMLQLGIDLARFRESATRAVFPPKHDGESIGGVSKPGRN